jgi:hypothetical protein
MTQKYSEDFIDKHRDINVHHDWWDSTYDDFKRICEILGIELDVKEPSFSGFCSQGDGASWTGRYRAQGLGYAGLAPLYTYDQAPAKIREYAPKDETLHSIADELCLLGRIYHPVYAKVGRSSHRAVHEMTMQIDEWEYYDEKIDFEGVDTEIVNHIEETLITQFRELARWLYTTLENEYNYFTSDEAVVETLEANKIEEDEDEDEDA